MAFMLMLPFLYFFYRITANSTFSKIIFGGMFWADMLFIAYAFLPFIDGKHLLFSILCAVPVAIIFYFGTIKLLDLGIQLCDYILKKTT